MSRQVATVPTGLQRVEVSAFLPFPRKEGDPILSAPGGVGEKDARYPLPRAYTFPSSPSAKWLPLRNCRAGAYQMTVG